MLSFRYLAPVYFEPIDQLPVCIASRASYDLATQVPVHRFAKRGGLPAHCFFQHRY